MKITSDYNQLNKQTAFMAKPLSFHLLRGKAVTRQFIKEVSFSPRMKKAYSIIDVGLGSLNAFFCASNLSDAKYGSAAVSTAAAVALREASLGVHKNAIKNAPELAKRLQDMGFTAEEKQKLIKSYLRNDGDIVFSNLFNLFCPKRVAKLAEGESVKDVFLSLFSRTGK